MICDDSAPASAAVAQTGRLVVDMSMSLDGFVTAAGADLDHGLGVGGEPLHAWALDAKTAADTEIIEAAVARTGAILMGPRTFDFVDGPNGWRGDLGYGAERDQHAPPPAFVVTHTEADEVRLQGRFTFVTNGLHEALANARVAAQGKTSSSWVEGTLLTPISRPVSSMWSSSIRAHRPRRRHIAVASPSTATHRLELVESVSTPEAEHLTYRVRPKPDMNDQRLH